MAVDYGSGSWQWIMAADHGSGLWQLIMAVDYGSGSWQWIMAVDHGRGSWQWIMAADHGSGSWQWDYTNLVIVAADTPGPAAWPGRRRDRGAHEEPQARTAPTRRARRVGLGRHTRFRFTQTRAVCQHGPHAAPMAEAHGKGS